MSNLKACTCCTRTLTPLDDYLGAADGLHHYNCDCGASYTLRTEDLEAWKSAWRDDYLRRLHPTKQGSAVSRLADIILKRVNLPEPLKHLEHGGTLEVTEAEAAALLEKIEGEK